MAHDATESGDRPADDEIEITPEMLAAGIREFVAYDDRFEGVEDVVPEIFRAMLRARRS